MPERLRLCIVITALGVGGAEHALLRLLSRFDREQFDISMIVLGREDALAERFAQIGVRLTMLRLTPGRWPFGEVERFLQAVRAINPDVIQGWMYHGNLAASFAAARLQKSVPICWSVRDTPDAQHGHSLFTRMVIRLSGWYAQRTAKIFNVSSRSAAYCAEHLGWPSAQTEILPNGVDTALFVPNSATRLAMRTSWGVSSDCPLIGMVARWSPVKNHALFLDAAADLCRKRPHARFALVGAGLDSTNAVLMAQVRRLDLADKVRLLGPRDDLQNIYPAFDVVALTSKSEGFPNVLAEAMSCGVPVVSTDVGDARDIVGDGGLIVPATPQAFSAAFERLLDQAIHARLSASARSRIQERYALDAIAARLEQSYRMLVAR
ncbi:MAG TPA: glycosyltransferase [Rhodocyclaceae bacterium]|nr:glycosyltransferase [Rhodocyclaceae bacterium]